jgi:hypothetical protein
MDRIRIRRRIRIRVLRLRMGTQKGLRRTDPHRSSHSSLGLLMRRRCLRANCRRDGRHLRKGRKCLRKRRRRLSLRIIFRLGRMCLDRCLRLIRRVGCRSCRLLHRRRRISLRLPLCHYRLLLRRRMYCRLHRRHRLRSHLLLLHHPRIRIMVEEHRRRRWWDKIRMARGQRGRRRTSVSRAGRLFLFRHRLLHRLFRL